MTKRQKSITIIPLILDTHLSVIKNSVGSKMFQHAYALVNGKKKDLLRNGELSCAVYVSFVLLANHLLKEMHSTVTGTLKDMKQSGWRRIRKPRPGCVILWEPILYPDGEKHWHLGFFLNNKTAVSNSASRRVPIHHHWTYKGKRKIASLWWHPKLK